MEPHIPACVALHPLYYISVERQGTLKDKQDGTKQKGKAMNVWEKLNHLADYLNEDALLSELAGYIPVSQLENAVEYIAWENDIVFNDNDESEE